MLHRIQNNRYACQCTFAHAITKMKNRKTSNIKSRSFERITLMQLASIGSDRNLKISIDLL